VTPANVPEANVTDAIAIDLAAQKWVVSLDSVYEYE
jgi:hypothetical protein